MEGLDFNNILSAGEVDTLFQEPEDTTEEETSAEKGSKAPDEHGDTGNKTTETDSGELFGGLEEEPEKKEEKEPEQSESVGSGKETEGEGDSSTDGSGGSSPNENLYSSMADALAEDGVFPNLDEETVRNATDAESLSDLFEQEVLARLDDKTRRVAKALENGIEPTDVRKYENTLDFIHSIKESDLNEESEKGEQLRRNLIYQDYINKGYSAERAQKLTQRSLDNGTDVEDAKDALQGNLEFFQKAYDNLLQEAEQEAQAAKAERKKQTEKLKDGIMKDKSVMGDMDISLDMRRKTFDNITKPVYRDPETGEYLTALQKYESEHRADFLKYAGLFYTLTNGFKDFKSFTKGQVKTEVRKGLRELEAKLSNTKRSSDGSLKMVSTVKDDPESYFGDGFRLDI